MASQVNIGFDIETSDGNAKAAAIRIGNMIFSSFLRSVVSSFAQSIFNCRTGPASSKRD